MSGAAFVEEGCDEKDDLSIENNDDGILIVRSSGSGAETEELYETLEDAPLVGMPLTLVLLVCIDFMVVGRVSKNGLGLLLLLLFILNTRWKKWELQFSFTHSPGSTGYSTGSSLIIIFCRSENCRALFLRISNLVSQRLILKVT